MLPTFECFASVVPIRKLLSAQLSKTLVSTCFYYNLQNLTFIFLILLGLYKY